MGNIIDLVMNKLLACEFSKFDVRSFQKICFECYDKVVEVKFLEKTNLTGDLFHDPQKKKLFYLFIVRGMNLLLVPNKIGHTVGSCSWRIEADLINIIYMISYNHKLQK